MLVVFLLVFYFLLIRPQMKRNKDQRELMNALQKGDEVITSGGLLAKVVSIDEQYIKVTIADGVEVSLQRSAVSTVLPKGTLKSL